MWRDMNGTLAQNGILASPGDLSGVRRPSEDVPSPSVVRLPPPRGDVVTAEGGEVEPRPPAPGDRCE